MGRYLSNASRAPRVAPIALPWPIPVVDSLDKPFSIGIAYAAGHVGGWRGGEYLGKPEAVWRLVIGKQELEGRFVLRSGEFVELAEDAW